jgi:hypothetical protein
MAKPNYQYEKRQKDLAKQRKRQEKEQERAARKAGKGPEVTTDAVEASPPEAPIAEAGQKSDE